MSSILHMITALDTNRLVYRAHINDVAPDIHEWTDPEEVAVRVNDNRPIVGAACATNRGGDLHICAFDGPGNLPSAGPGNMVHTIRFADGSWQPFLGDVKSQIPQGPTPQFSDNSLACAANKNGDLHVCTIDTLWKMVHAIRFTDGSWQPFWGDVQSQITRGPTPTFENLTVIACAANPAGDLHICANSLLPNPPLSQEPGPLVHTIRFADGSWQPFCGNVQSQLTQGPIIDSVDSIACAANKGGDLHICAIVSAGTVPVWLAHTIRYSGGSWQPFWGDVQAQVIPLGLTVNQPAEVSCCFDQAGNLHVCVFDTSGEVWFAVRRASGEWIAFDRFAGGWFGQTVGTSHAPNPLQ